MTINPERFNEQFSVLTNSLQTALELAEQRSMRATGEMLEASELYDAVRRAVDAVRDMRPTDGDEQS